MKRDTRQEIMQAAKTLFNERGYNAVSIHDIAEALGISKGNLTYHFKKKEDIVEALITESGARTAPASIETLADMDEFLFDKERVVGEKAWYFWHHAQLSQVSPKIHDAQRRVYLENVGILTRGFEALRRDGFIRKEEYRDEYRHIIDTLLMSSIYWRPFSEIKRGEQDGPETAYRRHGWAILYPLLTEHGKDALRTVVGLIL